MEELFSNLNNLTTTDEKIINYLLEKRHCVDDLNIQQIAKDTFTSPASVTRLSKKVGFSGFTELKFALKKEVLSPSDNQFDATDYLKSDMEKTSNFIENYNFHNFNQMIKQSKKIYVFGTDWGERNAVDYLVRNFMSIGIDMIMIPSITELKWIVERVVKNSTFIIVSFSGENEEVVNNIKKLKFRDANLISITRFSKNQLSLIAPVNLYYHTTRSKKINEHLEYNLFAPLHLLLDAVFSHYFKSLSENDFID